MSVSKNPIDNVSELELKSVSHEVSRTHNLALSSERRFP